MRRASVEETLREQLRRDGLSNRAVEAVWPRWWSDEAEHSASATTELKFTLARRLGLSPAHLFDDGPEFVWRDDARFKNLGELNEHEASVLASFCVGVGLHVIGASRGTSYAPRIPNADTLRESLLSVAKVISLRELLFFCWSAGIPVVQMRVFPLHQKGMHAVTTRAGSRHAVLIGRESRFRAQVAFWLAHEIGHIALGHLQQACALLDVEEPVGLDGDEEERAADAYALELLTGSDAPNIVVNTTKYSATQLASAVINEAPRHAVDPAVLALCTAYAHGHWDKAFGALKILNDEDDVSDRINELAASQLALDQISSDNASFLRTVLGIKE